MAMKKIKTAEATGRVLDWMVAVCQGYAQGGNEVAVAESGEVIIRRHNVIDYFDPHRNWGWGGPIIDREKIATDPDADDGQWAASTRDAPCYWVGPTPLIAAMRCYVASKLGDTVEVPEELT